MINQEIIDRIRITMSVGGPLGGSEMGEAVGLGYEPTGSSLIV